MLQGLDADALLISSLIRMRSPYGDVEIVSRRVRAISIATRIGSSIGGRAARQCAGRARIEQRPRGDAGLERLCTWSSTSPCRIGERPAHDQPRLHPEQMLDHHHAEDKALFFD